MSIPNKIGLVKFKFKRVNGSLSGDFNLLDSSNIPVASHKSVGFWSLDTRKKLSELIKLMEEDVSKNVFGEGVQIEDKPEFPALPTIPERAHAEWEVENDIAEQF